MPVLWLGWFYALYTQEVLSEGGYQGKNLAAYGRWLGLRARQKVQGAVVSNGMWLLWTVLRQDKRVGVGVDRDEEGGREVISTAAVGEGAEAGEDMSVLGTRGEEDMLMRRERVIQWLSVHCIYCEVTGAPESSSRHWYETCRRSKGIADSLGYEESLEWQDEMEQFRRGKCEWCQQEIDECGVRESLEKISCPYGDIILPVLFLLHGRGWLKDWLRRSGYRVAFGAAQLQKWLNERSDVGGVKQTRGVEAFEAYIQEFQRAG